MYEEGTISHAYRLYCQEAEEGKMDKFRVDLYEKGEYTYAASYGFMPNLMIYLHEDEEIRPCMMVVPGGGYCMVCGHEGEVVAREFYKRGMNVMVLTYTTDITMSVPLKTQPLKDISRAVRILRKHHKEYRINPEKLVICGFSAGAHVCASLCTHFSDIRDENENYGAYSNRPDASILCYPVITSGEYTHIYSIQALLGKSPSGEEMEYFSLEKQVTGDTPPCFLWQTAKDDLVPVENSYLYAMALRKAGVDFAHYVFPSGGHGMSIANRELAMGTYPGDYTYEQLGKALEHIKNRTAIDVSPERYRELTEQFFSKEEEKKEDTLEAEQKTTEETSEKEKNVIPDTLDVGMWPELAWDFLQRILY